MIVNSNSIQGWKIHHQEHLMYRANAGSPTIRLKFFHYPNYRQTVHLHKTPSQCKLKSKWMNVYFLYQQKVNTKGVIPLDRSVSVFPITSSVSLDSDWGKITEIPQLLKDKYHESSKYWPVKSPTILNLKDEDWFRTDDLSKWIKLAYRYIRTKIKHLESQDERLGAYQAILTAIGDCDEFTDLFITLARIRGIPSRRLTGYYILKQGELPEAHAWGEIFSPEIGWITTDVALNNIGSHTKNYIILKIEEFNHDLPDYQVQTKHSTTVHYEWQRSKPVITPIYNES
ncbi:MAG: transglutaminase-like domain-containing protein [Candidatus Hodarchaeota archaeon]